MWLPGDGDTDPADPPEPVRSAVDVIRSVYRFFVKPTDTLTVAALPVLLPTVTPQLAVTPLQPPPDHLLTRYPVLGLAVSVTRVPQFTVRVVGLTQPPVPAAALSVHWLRAKRTLTLRLVLALVDVPTGREQSDVMVPGPLAGELVQPVQLET